MYKLISMLALSSVFARAVAVDGDTGPDNSTTPTTVSGEITIHDITVGKVPNSFQPNSIQAKPGDIVQFHFYPTNHSVIRSAYGYPCIPYESVTDVAQGQGQGFYSGPQLVNDTAALATWNLTINNTDPVFFYCGAPGSCYGWGMLGVINANSQTDLTKQIAIARQESYEIWPGQQLPLAAAASLAAIASTATAHSSSTSSTSSASASATSSAAAAPASSSSISGGAIAGIVIGALVVVLGAIGIFFLMARARRNKRDRSARQPLQPIQVGTYQGPDYMQSPGFHQGMASPGLSHAQLPPYAAKQEMKGPYGEHSVQYIPTPLHSPPPHMSEHPSYFDYRNGTPPPGSPPPHSMTRMSIASELDGSALHTARATPALNSVQELDSTHTNQQHELHS